LICIDFSLQILQLKGQGKVKTGKRKSRKKGLTETFSQQLKVGEFPPQADDNLMKVGASIFKLTESPQKLARPKSCRKAN